ncbi:MAG: hypothetical protein WAX89_07720 [Alphaproteobacteria bacterium]
MDWQIAALLSSIFGAFCIHINHVFKVDGAVLVLLRMVPMALLVGLSMLFLTVPQGWVYYAWGLAGGVAVAVADVLILNAAITYGGRLTALFLPLKIFMVFAAWLAIDAAARASVLNNLPLLAGVLLCFFAIFMSMLSFRRNDAQWRALMAVAPVAALYSFDDICLKFAFASQPDVWGASAMMLLINCVVGGVLAAVWLVWQQQRMAHIFTWPNVYGTATQTGLVFLAAGTFYLAIAGAPNPAYVSAIGVLSAVWLAIYYKLSRGDDASVFASTLMLGSAMVLAILTGGQ